MNLVRLTLSEMPPSTNGLRKSFVQDGKVMSARWADDLGGPAVVVIVQEHVAEMAP